MGNLVLTNPSEPPETLKAVITAIKLDEALLNGGTDGDVLTSNGPGEAPSYQPVAAGGGISGLTAGFIPLAGSATTITGDAHLDDGVTTPGFITSSEPMSVATAFKVPQTGTYGITLSTVTGLKVETAASLGVALGAGGIQVNQDQADIAGSVSGDLFGVQPFNPSTSTYGKAVLVLANLSGTATYTFPVPFQQQADYFIGAAALASGATVTDCTLEAITVAGTGATNGTIIVEGF